MADVGPVNSGAHFIKAPNKVEFSTERGSGVEFTPRQTVEQAAPRERIAQFEPRTKIDRFA
jgi:hypothetical protein